MIAKVIVHGPSRAAALSRLSAALDQTQVAGTVTNLAFLGALAADPAFAAGDVDTGLIAREIDALVAAPEVTSVHKAAAAQAALGLAQTEWDSGFTLWGPLRQSVTLAHGEEDVIATVEVRADDLQHWDVGGAQIVCTRVNGQWLADGKRLPDVALAGDAITVFAGYGLSFTRIDPLDQASAAAGDGNVIEAPMPGLVKAVFARAGQEVKEGDRLAILEAMKMEHSLLAARDGVVAEVMASEGDQVEAGAALIQLEDA
jgi:3-methylcrotonyl-CoA carboxylase alpha subunit